MRAEGAHGNNVRVPETPERLRIVLLDSIPVWGGGQKWMRETAQALTRRGHYVAVACATGSVLEQRTREAGLPLWTVLRLAGYAGFVVLLAEPIGRRMEATLLAQLTDSEAAVFQRCLRKLSESHDTVVADLEIYLRRRSSSSRGQSFPWIPPPTHFSAAI